MAQDDKESMESIWHGNKNFPKNNSFGFEAGIPQWPTLQRLETDSHW